MTCTCRSDRHGLYVAICDPCLAALPPSLRNAITKTAPWPRSFEHLWAIREAQEFLSGRTRLFAAS